VTSKYLCKSSKSKTVTIYPKPKARFEVAKTIECPPFLLPIQNLTVTEPIVNYNWNFGDGNSFTTQVLETVSHTFENATADIASYNLVLNVATEHNCSDTYTQTINVYPHVIANFTPDTVGCSPLLVLFNNKTVRGETFLWNFGDQVTTKITSPSHKYFNPEVYDSTYTATLIALSKYECSDTVTRKITVYPQPEAEFSALPSHLYFPDNRISIKNETNVGNWNYKWNFADGQTSLVQEPKSHEFMHWGGYDVQLNVWSQHCKDSITHHIRVFPPIPIADFDMSENGCVPWTIKFTDKSTWTSSWYWEFDDGSTSTEQNPSHIYETAGKFEVKLTVTGDGGTAFTYRTIEIFPKPTVIFKYSPALVMLGDAKVQFYNNSKLGTRFLWDFGDSAKSAELEPTHTYQAIGKYNVVLSAWSIHECFDSLRVNFAVEVIGTGDLRFPNAFKPDINGPNGGKFSLPDPLNQVFHPFYQGVVEYHLEIYDRLGEKLFDSTDPGIGWDGYYKNRLCKSDVYIWRVIGKFSNGKTFDMAGDVTLLK
jgi:PKD repeat protein